MRLSFWFYVTYIGCCLYCFLSLYNKSAQSYQLNTASVDSSQFCGGQFSTAQMTCTLRLQSKGSGSAAQLIHGVGRIQFLAFLTAKLILLQSVRCTARLMRMHSHSWSRGSFWWHSPHSSNYTHTLYLSLIHLLLLWIFLLLSLSHCLIPSHRDTQMEKTICF